MNAKEHLKEAMDHLKQAEASPMLIGAKAAENARAQIGLARTFVRLSGEQLDRGATQLRLSGAAPFDHRRAAANEDGDRRV